VGGGRAVLGRELGLRGTCGLGGRGPAIRESRGGLVAQSSMHPAACRTGQCTAILHPLTSGVIFYFCFIFLVAAASGGHDLSLALTRPDVGPPTGRPPTTSTVASGFGSFLPSPPSVYVPFLPLLLHLSPFVMLTITPYDRYAPDNSSRESTPPRRRISFSRKAAPVLSIVTASATSTGQENRSPTNCIPFPSTSPPISSAHTCLDAMYIPSTLEPAEHTSSAHSHRRQRSNSGLMSIQQIKPRSLATLNSVSRATIGCIDLGKSTAVLSITSSGAVTRADNDYLSKTLATARQRRLLQLDRKRNVSMVTKKQTKTTIDAKFLITLHHSITWHIENRSDVEGWFLPFCWAQNVWKR